MLREPQSLYKGGRSESLRKFKEFFDAEVKVLQSKYPYGFDCLQYVFFKIKYSYYFKDTRQRIVCWIT
jgi:hypothetical protein